MQNWLSKVIDKYKLLPVKLQLFLGMLVASNTAALAIYLAFLMILDDVNYWACLATFLAVRVYLFMANPSMELNDKNVTFMSSERTLWNLATIAVLAAMICLKSLIS